MYKGCGLLFSGVFLVLIICFSRVGLISVLCLLLCRCIVVLVMIGVLGWFRKIKFWLLVKLIILFCIKVWVLVVILYSVLGVVGKFEVFMIRLLYFRICFVICLLVCVGIVRCLVMLCKSGFMILIVLSGVVWFVWYWLWG